MSEAPTGDARLVDRSLARVGERRGVRTSMAALSKGTSSQSGPWVMTMPPTC